MTTTLSAIGPSVNGWNADYLDQQYQAFKADPASIAPDLVGFFQGFDLAMASSGGAAAGGASGDHRDALRLHLGVRSLIDAYRRGGHFASMIDPFGRKRPFPATATPLAADAHGLTAADMGKSVGTVTDCPLTGDSPTLSTLITRLTSVYCGSIGAQFMHIADSTQRQWWINTLESKYAGHGFDRDDKLAILTGLVKSETFERFLAKRYPGDKRFSLEGGEALIPVTERILEVAADLGVAEIVIGMAHRGRLNVLNNILGKSYEQIFTEFEETFEEAFSDGGGDVKYHRGYSGTRKLRTGRSIQLSLSSNPSHLEAVDSVTLGRVRAKQRLRGDTTDRRSVVPILIHGDAAVIGQGVVAETLNMSQLQGYTVGGTIHLVTNNLIGFTTLPEDARGGPYCTDLALSIDAPVLHVSGEDPEAAVMGAALLMQYRHKFRRDVFLDLVCFRKYGHNEQDEASFTQPTLDKLIKAMPGVVTTFTSKLAAEGVLSADDLAKHRTELDTQLDVAQKRAKDKPHDPTIDPMGKRWSGMGFDYSFKPVATSVDRKTLETITAALGNTPQGFEVNPKLKKLLTDRAALLQTGAISHADGETLAFGSLLLEGTAVRLSGQDCRRGTFSHRHAVLRDFNTGEPYTPLNNMRPVAESPDKAGKPGADGKVTQSKFCVYDSPLSEFAVMGFDYGYSLADPNMLVMWEGQFGDFCNGAQTIIDQFIASAEIKWERYSGLTLLLPHGYEGAGPEHSSARLERFLQLCGNDNMQVCYPTTGAQIFHLLRRQVRRNFRKPLVVMSPKSMLRVPTSHIDELMTGHFQDIMDDPAFEAASAATTSPTGKALDRSKVTRVVLCSGKVYHELAERRLAIKRPDVAIVRLEQLYPFNAALFKAITAKYPAKAEMVYAQEEPRNAGAYTFIADLLTNQPDPTKDDANAEPLLGTRLKYIGRPTSATPATGSKKKSKKEQEAVLSAAIGPAPAGGKDDHGKPAAPAAAAAKPAPAAAGKPKK